MKIRPIYNCRFLGLLGQRAVTIYPFILFEHSLAHYVLFDVNVLKHEMIHVRQIERDGFLKFYFKYLFQYLRGRLWGKAHWLSYMEIEYEREAWSLETLPLTEQEQNIYFPYAK